MPIDPDVAGDTVDAAPFATARPARSTRRPRLRWDILAVVFAGGCLGGWARYAITSTWPTASGRFPWAVFDVNVSGAFVLAVVVVLATDVVSSRYARPLLGTGFCGAFTTFSSIVVTADELFAHGHAGLGAAYLAASIAGGLAAAWLGVLITRGLVARHAGRGERRPA
jgi:CrcB protein